MTNLLDPKDLELRTASGAVKTFVLTKFPAIAGREILAKYPVANLPKLGDYDVSKDIMLKAMAYVGVRIEGRDEPQMLTTAALIDNHVEDTLTLARLEIAVLDHSFGFFGQGETSLSFDNIIAKLRPLISQMLTGLSEQSSPADEQASTS